MVTMVRARVVIAGAVMTFALLLPLGAADASPVAGGEFVRFDLNPYPAFFLVSPFGAPTPVFLPTSDCPFSPPPLGAAASAEALSASVVGWEGPVLDLRQTRQVDLHATVRGTITDTRGDVYHVSGSFRETGETLSIEVPFFGSGHLTITGPGGVVNGEALFVDVASGPPEWDFYFTEINTCFIR